MPDPAFAPTPSRRILLAVTGLSPQVVTETLYVLAKGEGEVPTEIHLITTAPGRERAELALLSDQPGWFHRLRRDLKLPPIDFSPDHIHCVCDSRGKPLDDIRTVADNERLADLISEKVRSFTADPESSLHASIAGGRKTMGFYLGYALSLYGRPQDRLSHVLVSEPFESSWNFFYPTPYSQVIETRDGALADTRNATVTLADIPFVSLRHGLPEKLLTGRARYSETVAAARKALAPPRLVIDLAGQRIRAGDEMVPLPPRELALYSLFARRAAKGQGPLPAPPKDVPDSEWRKWFIQEYKNIRSHQADDIERTEKALQHGMDGDYFSTTKSKLHAALKKALGPAAAPYLIDDGGKRPRQYSLKLPPEAVRFGKLAGKERTQRTGLPFNGKPEEISGDENTGEK